MKSKKFDIYFFIILLVLLITLKYNALDLPYYWDGMNYVIPTIDYIYHNSLTLDLWSYDLGHPPFFFLFTGVLFKIFGDSTIVGNLSVLLFAFLTLYFVYLIGKELFNRKVGIIVSLLLLFTPIFFSYSALLYIDIPLTALITIALYFAIISKPFPYFIFGSLALLTKESGIVVILGVFLAKLLKKKKFNKDVIIYASPILVFFSLLIFNKIYYGHFLYPISTSMIQFHFIKTPSNALMILKILFFDQYRWILTSLSLLSFIKISRIKTKNLFYSIIASSIFFIILMNIKIINSLLSPHYPNVENYLNLVKLFSPLFALSFLIISLFYKDIFNFFNNKRFYEPILTMLFLLGMHTLIIPVAPRYVLPIFPILFIFYGYSINNLFKKYAYIVLIILILLFSLNFIGQRGDVGFALETNMEYVDSIYIHQLAANYIENNYPNSTILAAYPQSSELKYPYNKYVNNPINVITISPLPGLTERNYTKFLYANLYKEPDINLSKIDLYYHSKQEYPTKGIDDAAKKLNLTLLKKFELNNKTVEIYLVNKLNTFV